MRRRRINVIRLKCATYIHIYEYLWLLFTQVDFVLYKADLAAIVIINGYQCMGITLSKDFACKIQCSAPPPAAAGWPSAVEHQNLATWLRASVYIKERASCNVQLFYSHFRLIVWWKIPFTDSMHEPANFACWEGTIRTNRPLRIKDCCLDF